MSPLVLRFLTEVRRARLLAVLAGLAWLLGVNPPAAVRILLTVVVAVALVLDALADAATDTTLTLPAGPARGDRS
ncbi:hypothetical protein [Streptomyces sp. NBC_01198]|uniref:hypothetical protein n=1 Tax=Streptomyces sp. NBC_01198 TaxID=2903769 RepID=UPI002E144599|nr:hypothetical protein OG702_26680 [Streptomyces sp. NBC_01198]